MLYEKRSMSKAAESLYITQSALSKRLKSIEDEFNIEVVKRTSTGVIFTDEGRYMVTKARAQLAFMREIREHFAEGSSTKELLTMGVPNSFARVHMAKLFREYKDKYDRVQIKTVSNSSDVIIQQLTDGSVDIGIVCGDYPFIGEKIRLFEEKLYVLVPKNMSFEAIGQQPVIKSYLNPLVQLLVDQWWHDRFGTVQNEAFKVPYHEIAIAMVENGLGITFLFGNHWVIDHEKADLIEVYDASGAPVTRNVWLMAAEKCFKSPDIMDFISMVEEHYNAN